MFVEIIDRCCSRWKFITCMLLVPCLLQLHCMEFVGNWSPGLMSCSWTCDCLIRNEMNRSAVHLQSLTPQIYTW